MEHLQRNKKSRAAMKNRQKTKRNESITQIPHELTLRLGASKTNPDQASTVQNKKKEKEMKRRKGMQAVERKRRRTMFEEYLEMDRRKGSGSTAEEDLELERKLAKKLKRKGGLFPGPADGISDLLEGMADFMEERDGGRGPEAGKQAHIQGQNHTEGPESSGASLEEDDKELSESDELDERTDLIECSGEGTDRSDSSGEENTDAPAEARNPVSERGQSQKYVAPHLRMSGSDSNELTQVRRRARGLLNRLSEDNVESIAQEFVSLFQVHGRRIMTDIVTDEVMEAVSTGPRGNEQYAAVFAAFVAGISCSVGMVFGAKFIASLAQSFENYFNKGDSLAVRNITLLLSYIYTFKLLSRELIYDLMGLLSKRLGELDVATILNILQSCGMSLRADDPLAMKEFVLAVQHQYEELKAAAAQGKTTVLTGKRMEFMLETILEIKNNKKRVKPESTPHARLKKWLQKLGVEEVQLRALTWKKLLDPDKKGQWWIGGGLMEAEETRGLDILMDKEAGDAEKMLQLAALQRMNTDTRRAVFCIVMSGEDYLDAFEKILRLNLPGKQDREILRVIVECCLQEKMFNKYYSLLVRKLCQYDKNHKFTLQYCLWDHFKQLSSMDTRRISNLAHFLADVIANYSLSLSVLKVVDFTDAKTLNPKVIWHFRIFLKVLLTSYTAETVWNTFSRIATAEELDLLRSGLSVFLHQHVVKAVQISDLHDEQRNTLLIQRAHIAKKALANSTSMGLK